MYLDGNSKKIEQNYVYYFEYNEDEKAYKFTDLQ